MLAQVLSVWTSFIAIPTNNLIGELLPANANSEGASATVYYNYLSDWEQWLNQTYDPCRLLHRVSIDDLTVSSDSVITSKKAVQIS